jgi:phosphoglycerate transport regulatory protein PgtC
MAMRRKARHFPSRRSILLGSLAASTAILSPARAQTVSLQVVTSFPEELTTRYEQEFEKAHPGAHVQFVWKQSRDALEYLSQPKQSGADVYWAPSPNNFFLLRDRGAFSKISVDRAVLPGRLNELQLSDPNGYFEVYDVAGYGVVANPALLKQRGLDAPQSWRDLASPAYSGEILMPIASKVGFSPALYDIILQSEGWDGGWALISEIAGNAHLLDAGHLPTREVAEGRAALGLTIDFFVLQARANGVVIDLIYPQRTAFLPAHVAVTASTQHAELAKAFVDFVLSKQGQRLLMEADSSRHPARPDAYENKPAGIADPFTLPRGVTAPYDLEIGRRRPGLVVSLFDILVTERHEKLAALWKTLHAAELKHAGGEAHSALAEARRLAGFAPVSAKDAADPAFLEKFANRDKIDPAIIQKWRNEIDAAHAKAVELVARAGATL